MSRKITRFIAMLFVTFFSLPALAQLEELNMKTVSFGEAAETLTPDTQWYLVYNKRNGGGYWQDDNCSDRHVRMSNGIDDNIIKEGDLASARANLLVRFISTDNENQYKIQFGTGNWMRDNLFTSANASDAASFNAYLINDEPAHFAFNVADMGSIIDNNGKGNDLSPWGTGRVESSGGNNDWTIYPVILGELSERDLLDIQINERMLLYEQYLEGREGFLDRGSEIGQYNVTDEEFNAWVAHVQKAFDILDGKYSDITNEEIRAELEAIDNGWAYIQSKLVPLVITNGNYRIVSAKVWTNSITNIIGQDPETNEDITETIDTHPIKAMYATLDTKQVKWDTMDETDCRYLWKVTNIGQDSIQVMNIATDGVINTCPQSEVATLDPESDVTMSFMFVKRNEEGKVVLSFKPQGGNAYNYLHCGGHNQGKGVNGNVVGWTDGNDADASQWILEPVDDETVTKLVEDYAPYKNHEQLVLNYQALQARADSAIAIAKDESYITSHGEGLLTSGDQFSSPFTCTADKEANGASFDNLFDGNGDTYWHSSWDATVPGHTHYFQVAFAEPIADGVMLQAYIARRTSARNDHITEMTVYGANDKAALDDATEESWTLLATLNTPWTNGQTEVSSNLFSASNYQYLRFYIDNTTGAEITNTRGYAHMAQFQLYPTVIDGQTQYAQMGEVRTTLEAALAKAAEMNTEELTVEDYKELEAAVEAFINALVNPAELANTINANKDAAKYVVTGNNPGQWAEGSNGDALNSLIAEATAYLKSGAYTQEKTDNYVKQITEAANGIVESANKVELGKWYSILFDSEANYDTYGWGKGNVVNTTLGDLYGNRLAPANLIDDGDGAAHLELFNSLEEVGINQNLRFVREDDVTSMDQLAFRFVDAGNDAYYIQHKSGLYVSSAGRGGSITLGLTPGLFDVKACGLGKVLIHTRNLKGEELYDTPIYLHAQNAGHTLVTWSASELSSNSALLIEPVGDFDEGEDVAEAIHINVLPNSMRIWCYPAGFKVKEGELFEYKGASIGDDEISLAFNKIEEAKAGQPVLYLNGDTAQFDKEMEMEFESLTLTGTEFAAEPDSVGGIHGTYAYAWVDPDITVVVAGGNFAQEGNHFEEASGEDNTDCTRDISANTGYIIPAENHIDNFNAADYDLVITLKKGANAIENITNVFSNRGDIYTTDGRLVKKNGTLSDVKSMGRGLYIIGGAKVLVK